MLLRMKRSVWIVEPADTARQQIPATREDRRTTCLTLFPASGFEVVDRVTERDEVEKLGVGWPDSAISGLLDVLMRGDSGPLL